MRFLFLGDFSYDYDYVAEDIAAIGDYARIKGASVILNLEGPVTGGNSRKIWKRGKNLRQKGQCIKALKALNTAGVTLANNHIMDFSGAGLKSTVQALEEAGIDHTGAGNNIKEALKPMVFSDGNDTVAVFSFGWGAEETVYAGLHKAGCAPRENRVVLDTVEKYAGSNPEHKIIVTLHWGFEYNLYPQPYDIGLGRKLCMIDSVLTVIGHHSHCSQPCETYNGKKIFYSLGNFYYGTRRIKYSGREFKNDPPNMCDYGTGVLINTPDERTEAVTVFYDRDNDRTEIREDMEMSLKMPDTDYNSYEYRDFVSAHSLRQNPVLGTDERENRIAVLRYNLARLRRKYFGR